MVGLSSVGHYTAPGNRYGDLNQDYAVSVGGMDRVTQLCTTRRQDLFVLPDACLYHPDNAVYVLTCASVLCCMQLVQHAFNKDELSGTSIWQQCCVAAVLDGG